MVNITTLTELHPTYRLFKSVHGNELVAEFDTRGFWFDQQTQIAYDQIKNHPHIYIAWDSNNQGCYIGKSMQNGGRWKRSHAYHLGTLAYHLLDTLRYDDQNHQHWIDAWFSVDSLNLGQELSTIELLATVNICFIKLNWDGWLNYNFDNVGPLQQEIPRKRLKEIENRLIDFNWNIHNLLNIIH